MPFFAIFALMTDGINPNIKRKKRSAKTAADYLHGLSVQDRLVVSEALTLVESSLPDQQVVAQEVLAAITEEAANDTIRIGATGSPGAGKSTLIEQLGMSYIDQGKKVAVLAIDPSSTRSEGSILGDKTRMPLLSNHPNAYVRPTASAAHLGGVSKTTRESIAICEQAGFDVIIIESVGVGQSEIELAGLVDVYLLVLLPGGGDDVQGIKRGVVEMADLLVINKADGDRLALAKQSKLDFKGSIHFFTHPLPGWKPQVILSSATEGTGIDLICEGIKQFVQMGKQKQYFHQRRRDQRITYIKFQVHRYIESIVEKETSIAATLQKAAEMDADDSLFSLTQRTLKEIAANLKS